ncbi:MAG: efflux RND transporter periplasmic adaptor subunit [Acidobacteriota bacterium]|nr:efflux RND transporter periplasmic adaptor subunit [Acidobacteriota bacterium]
MKQPLALAVFLMVSALAGCRDSTSSTHADQTVSAQTFVVNSATTQEAISVSGVVKPDLETDLAAQIVAPVSSITKHEGDHFRRGEVLVRLHAPALYAGVAQANAALRGIEKQEGAATAQATLAAATSARYTQLRERHSVTPYELDQMKEQNATAQAQQQNAAALVSAAQSALVIQQANAADANLYAPFDGVVTRRLVDPGAMAAPGVPLLHLQSSGVTEVEFSAPESLLNSLHVGSNLAVSLSNGSPLEARVANIAPAGDVASHSFLIKATLPASSVWSSGTLVQVSLPLQGSAKRTLIPSSAVIQQGGLDAVMAIDTKGDASVRYVTLGATSGTQTEVLTGVRPGDRLLVDGNLSLARKRVEVLP